MIEVSHWRPVAPDLAMPYSEADHVRGPGCQSPHVDSDHLLHHPHQQHAVIVPGHIF